MAHLRPRLRPHLRLNRHQYRGEVWYVIEDRIGAKHQRFNPQACRVIHLMDGQRTMDELWSVLSADLNDETPTQDEVLRVLSTLHAADLVQVDVTPDVAELLERRGKQVRQKWLARVGNPVFLRIPLFDPDTLLTRLGRSIPASARGVGVVLWLAVVLPALLMVPAHWDELAGSARDQLMAAESLLMLALLFPLVKVLHELGHGLACKAFGGEVHEAGVMLLVLYPVPYVEASAASAFVSKWQRALVGAAGMLTELFVAALAFYVWLMLEPGAARGIAYNVAALASVTTLFFNANPLLRFDGYYILVDLIEVPNLGARANRYWQHLAERFAFGVRQTEPPQATSGERRWFRFYAPAAYVYRLFVAFTIAIFVASQFFVIGVILACWALGQGVIWPIFKGLKALATGFQFAGRGGRIRAVLTAAAVIVTLFVFVMPMPHRTLATGVLWMPERAILRAESAGFVRSLRVEPGEAVLAGDPVLDMVEPGLVARLAVQQARTEELQVQHDAAWGQSQAKAQQLEQQLLRETAALTRLQEQASQMTLRARVGGTLLLGEAADLPGRFLKQGDIVGYVRTADAPLVRLAVGQDEVDPVRLDTRGIEVRLVHDSAQRWPAEFVRSTPAAARRLPSAALGNQGGGPLQTDPRDEQGMSTVESVFEFELRLPAGMQADFLGSHVHVLFEHTPEPVGWRAGRALRRLFLSHFST